MVPHTEGEVAVHPAGDVEALRLLELLWIAVRSGDHGNDRITGMQLRATELDVVRYGPGPHELRRRIEAQRFLDAHADQGWLAAQPFQLLGMREEAIDTARDQVGGRLRSGNEQNCGVRQ